VDSEGLTGGEHLRAGETMGEFGRSLKGFMQQHQIAVRELARRSGYSAGYVSELRRSLKHPSPEAARNIDDALGAGGTLAALVTAEPGTALTVKHAEDVTGILAMVPEGAVGDDDYDRLIQALTEWAEKVKRRDLLAVLGLPPRRPMLRLRPAGHPTPRSGQCSPPWASTARTSP
jgi:transcriptional regulator with XRE-family HTH domain